MKVLKSRRAVPPRPLVVLLTVVGALLLLWSCAPDSGFNTVSDYDTVLTHYDPDVDYQVYTTYYLADSVAYLKDPDDTSTIERDDEIDELILTTIAENMNAYGYQRITEPEEANPPDIFVPVSLTTTKWVGYYYPWYPPGWWYPWYPGWGPGYPGYYPPVEYTYSTGTIFFDFWDFKSPLAETEEFPILWTAAINGLLSDDRSSGMQRIVDSINQAFKQSGYLEQTDAGGAK